MSHRIWNQWHSFHYLVPIYEKVSRWGQCSWFGGQPQKEWTKAVLDDARGGFLSLHGLTWTTLLLSTKICNVFCELCDTNEWLQRPFCEYVFIYHVKLYSFSSECVLTCIPSFSFYSTYRGRCFGLSRWCRLAGKLSLNWPFE